MRNPSIIAPHGGALTEQILPPAVALEWVSQIDKTPIVPLDPFHYYDLICLATGVFSPVSGFQNRRAVDCIINEWRLPTNEIWPIPITLPIDAQTASEIKRLRVVRLGYQRRVVGIMQVEDLFWFEPEQEARFVYGTVDPSHPGVKRVLSQSPIRLAGAVTLTASPNIAIGPVFTPREMRRLIEMRGWRTVVAFQTRNPLHRAHEYVQKVALEQVDGLVIHPLIGATKDDDVPAVVRWKAYQALVTEYFPQDRVFLSGFPASMRYAGPREAVLHALVRKNYGFTHFIVGRDHAGVGSFYQPLASQNIFSQFDPSQVGIQLIFSDPAFFCRRCQQMATARTCPHTAEDHETLSGTRVRTSLRCGEPLPPHLIRPEVENILRDYFQNLDA